MPVRGTTPARIRLGTRRAQARIPAKLLRRRGMRTRPPCHGLPDGAAESFVRLHPLIDAIREGVSMPSKERLQGPDSDSGEVRLVLRQSKQGEHQMPAPLGVEALLNQFENPRIQIQVVPVGHSSPTTARY